MAELFVMVFEDGPYPDRYLAPQELSWPLPEKVKAKGYDEGCYVKTWQSPRAAVTDTEARGAKYTWNAELSYDSKTDTKEEK